MARLPRSRSLYPLQGKQTQDLGLLILVSLIRPS